jgi:hypothetical protein
MVKGYGYLQSPCTEMSEEEDLLTVGGEEQVL